MTIQHIDLSGPLDAATPLATIAAMSRQRGLQDQEMQQNTLQLQRLAQQIQESKKKADDEKAVTDIIKAGGSPEEVSQKLLKAGFPDQSRTYLTNAQADTLQAQQQALLRAHTLEGQVAPEVTASAPQTTTAPIQTSLTDPSQQSAPQVSAPATQQVPLPLPSVQVPFIGQPSTTIRPQSQQQLTLAERARQAFTAGLEARKKAAEGVVIPEGGTFHRDGQPDIAGQPKQTEIEKEAAPWLAKNPGKTLDDYVAFKQSSAQPHDVFQESYLPAYLRSHGIGPTSTQAQKDAVTLKANEDYKKIAQDPAMRDILETNAKSVRTDKSFALADSELKDIRKPIDAKADNIAQARDLLSQDNPGANSLAAPVIMKAVAGGQGSGVRITSAEINAVNGGRGKIDDFQSWLSSWSLDPEKYKKLLPDQKVWLKGVLDKIDQKIQAKQAAISSAHQSLIDSTDTTAHRQTMKDLNDSLEMIDRGAAKAPSGSSTTDNIRARLGLPPK